MSSFSSTGDQSIGALASVLSMNIQAGFPIVLMGLISLLPQVLLRVLSSTTIQKASILQCLAFFMVQLSHLYMTMEKTLSLTLWTFICKVMSLLLNTLSRCVIAFIPRSKHLWRYKASICHIKG